MTCVLPSQAALAQDGGALVRTNPPVLEIGEGQIETLQILLVNANNVYGMDLQARFDPAVVEVVDADPKQDGVQMTPGDFLKADFVVRNNADNKVGTLHYVVTQLNPTPPANGEGVILTIQFLGKVSGVKAELTFVSIQIADRRGVKPPVTAQDADLLAVPPKPPTPTPVPTATIIISPPTTFPPTVTLSRPPSATRPTESVDRNIPTNDAEENSVFFDRILIYVTMGGFSGSILLIGISFWMLASKRRKERSGK